MIEMLTVSPCTQTLTVTGRDALTEMLTVSPTVVSL